MLDVKWMDNVSCCLFLARQINMCGVYAVANLAFKPSHVEDVKCHVPSAESYKIVET